MINNILFVYRIYFPKHFYQNIWIITHHFTKLFYLPRVWTPRDHHFSIYFLVWLLLPRADPDWSSTILTSILSESHNFRTNAATYGVRDIIDTFYIIVWLQISESIDTKIDSLYSF